MDARSVAERTKAEYHSSSRAMSSMTCVQRGQPRTAVTSPDMSRMCWTRAAGIATALPPWPPKVEYSTFSGASRPPWRK